MDDERGKMFSCRMTQGQRIMITRLRGRLESLTGERVLVADVIARGLELLDEHTKKNPAHLGDTQG